MPNGGSDCCSSCWFNNFNEGQPWRSRSGLLDFISDQTTPAEHPKQELCTIRRLPIRVPGYTYCANHQLRNPGRIEIPIGPVREGNAGGYREVRRLSPDGEDVRLTLLSFLAKIEKVPQRGYRIGVVRDVVWQLGEFREKRAVDDLRRIANFTIIERIMYPIRRTRRPFARLALESLEKIRGTHPIEWSQEPEEAEHPVRRSRPFVCRCDICKSRRLGPKVQIPVLGIHERPESSTSAERPWWERILGR